MSYLDNNTNLACFLSDRMQSPFKPPSNHLVHQRDLFDALLPYKCSVKAILHSVSFFSIPSAPISPTSSTRRCLVSLSIAFQPGPKASLYDFSAAFVFSESSPLSPIILGYQFINLMQESRFLEDFGDDLQQSPSRLDERWYTNGYHDLFAAEGDLSDTDRVIWAVGKSSHRFLLQAEGRLGASPGVIETVPLCLLLDYLPPPSATLTASISITARLEDTTASFLSRFKHSKQHCIQLPVVVISQGPPLPLEEGDQYPSRRSFTFARTSFALSAGSTLPSRRVQPTSVDMAPGVLVGEFLESITSDQRSNLFRAGEEAMFDEMQQRLSLDYAASQGTTWIAIRRSINAIYSTARQQIAFQPPLTISGVKNVEEPVVEKRVRRDAMDLSKTAGAK